MIDGRSDMNIAMRLSIFATATLLSLNLSGSSQSQQADMTFFVTSVGPGNGGDLGGLAGADQHCQTLAQAVGTRQHTWRAYLSTNLTGGSVNARDRIGRGPWQNANGEVIAQNVDDLHSANNKITQQTAITEKGETLNGMFEPFNKHDMLTGSQADGRAFPGNLNLTCNNWMSSTFGVAMLGHHDRRGGLDNEFQRSWNSSHISRSCGQEDLIATGGNGLFYCFAAD
jgi:hypothetical protein